MPCFFFSQRTRVQRQIVGCSIWLVHDSNLNVNAVVTQHKSMFNLKECCSSLGQILFPFNLPFPGFRVPKKLRENCVWVFFAASLEKNLFGKNFSLLVFCVFPASYRGIAIFGVLICRKPSGNKSGSNCSRPAP